MGQKVDPRSFRCFLNKDWDSSWCISNKKKFLLSLHQDISIRNFIITNFKNSLIERVRIKRQDDSISVVINVVRYGVILGKGGADINRIKIFIKETANLDLNKVDVSLVEIKRPDASANIIAFNVVQQLEKRISFRKAMKRAISNAMRSGINGIKISVSGRLGGAEIARKEWYKEGSLPLHTLRANISYSGSLVAHTKYGTIGTKVWVYNK